MQNTDDLRCQLSSSHFKRYPGPKMTTNEPLKDETKVTNTLYLQQPAAGRTADLLFPLHVAYSLPTLLVDQ